MKFFQTPPRIQFFLNPYLLLPLLALFISLARLHTYDETVERDIPQFAVYAHEMLNGRRLNSDLWPVGACGGVPTYALSELIAGYNNNRIFLLNVLSGVLSLVGIYKAGKILSGPAAAGILDGPMRGPTSVPDLVDRP